MAPLQYIVHLLMHLFVSVLIYVCIPTPLGVPAWGIHPGTPPLPPAVSSEQGGILTDFAPATWSRVRAGILCLPTLGVPYAGGEPAHRGIYPITCPLFNEKKGTLIKV